MIVAALLVVLHTLDSRPVYINPNAVVSIGEVRSDSKVLHHTGHCLLTFSNGKLLTVIEDCPVVRQLLNETKEQEP